jgi:hypothetical protein
MSRVRKFFCAVSLFLALSVQHIEQSVACFPIHRFLIQSCSQSVASYASFT